VRVGTRVAVGNGVGEATVNPLVDDTRPSLVRLSLRMLMQLLGQFVPPWRISILPSRSPNRLRMLW